MSAVLGQHSPPAAQVNLSTPQAAQAALRTFWRLAEAWKLTTAEQLGLLGVARTTLYQWRQGKVGPLEAHVLERLSYLFGIYAALQILLPVPERANEWIRKPNTAPFLGGSSALQRMLGGQVADLFVVRQYLDAERGGKA
jgi:transcriptional regulator with XRE-family HTH domain